MLRKSSIFLIQIFIFQFVYAKGDLHILLNTSGGNPYSADAPSSAKTLIESAVMSKLIQVNNNLVAPKLLKEAYYDYQTKEYILVLKDDLYFHNKRKVNIEDLEFSLLRLYFASGKSHGIGALDNILGIEQIQQQNLTQFKSGVVSGVKIVAPNTLKIKLVAPDPNFLYMISDPTFSLVPIEELDSAYMNWKTMPVGAGPYAISGEGFKNGVVKLKKIDPKLDESVDEVFLYTKNDPSVIYDISLVKMLDSKRNNYAVYYSRYPISHFGLTCTNVNELGNNLNFRKFVQAALNSEEFIKYADGFSSVYEVLPLSKWGISNLKSPYNPELAKKYYAEIPAKLKNQKWNITIYSAGNSVRSYKKDFMEEIKKQLGLFGFKMDYIPVTSQFLPKNLAKNTPFDVSSIQVDPYDNLFKFSRLTKNGEDEFVKPLFDAKLEHLYASTLKAETLESKFKLLDQLNEYVHEQAYWVPLLQRKAVIYYNSKTVKTLMDNDIEIYHLELENIRMLIKNEKSIK